MYTSHFQSPWREHHTELFPSFAGIRKYDTPIVDVPKAL